MEAERRADACESNTAIYADDENAVEKLQEKIDKSESFQARMRKMNAAHAKFKKNPDGKWREGMTDAEQEVIRQYVPAYSWEPHPFPPYRLSNNNANIVRMKKRLEQLSKRQEATERPERRIGDVRLVDNMDFHKVELHFPGKPDAKVIASLKGWGFRWIRTAGCWARSIDNATEARLKWLADMLGQTIEAAPIE